MTIYSLFLWLAGAGILLFFWCSFEGQRRRGELSGVSGQGIGCLCWDYVLFFGDFSYPMGCPVVNGFFAAGRSWFFSEGFDVFSYPKGASVANRSFAAGASVFDMILFSYSKTSPAVDGFPPSGALVTISPHLRLCAG